MKILILTPYIYDRRNKEFTRNKTGFGMMINDIFQTIRQKEKVCLCSYVITSGRSDIANHKITDIVVHSRLRDWIRGIKFFLRYPQTIKGRIQYLYYFVNKGYLADFIERFKPDVINIHGLGYETMPFIEISEELHIPYIVTLHGLIGLDDSIEANVWDKNFERDFLIKAYNEGIPVTVVSTGIKRRIQDEYLRNEAANITVITNGTRVPYSKFFLNNQFWNLREKFNLSATCKICVVMGTVNEKKNYLKIIDMVGRMSKSILENVAVFICGEDSADGVAEEKIRKSKLQNTVFILGYLQHDDLKKVLGQADLNVIASKDVGFGLSIVESFSFGIPTISFENIEVMNVLKKQRALIIANRKEIYDCTRLMEQALMNDWNRNTIKEGVKKIPFDEIEGHFLKKYVDQLKNGVFPSLMKTRDYLYLRKRKGAHILVYIGNISDNKNQIAAVSCMKYLSSNYVLVLLGREDDGGRIREMIIRGKLYNKVILAGFCNEMNEFWKYADLNLFLSKNDGFGLSIIEGFMRGVPALINKNLDAADDLYIEEGIRYLENLEPENLATQITDFIKVKPEKQAIVSKAVKYSLETMADNYLKLMRKQNGVEEEYIF